MIGALMAKSRARKRFAARAANDVDAFLESFAEDAVFKFPGEPPIGGTFRGREAIRAQFEMFRERAPNIRFELVDVCVNRLFAFGPTNEVAVQWRMQLGDLCPPPARRKLRRFREASTIPEKSDVRFGGRDLSPERAPAGGYRELILTPIRNWSPVPRRIA